MSERRIGSQRSTARATDGRLTRDVAPGVHQLEHAHVNCYLIESDDGVTIVDTAFPNTWTLIHKALDAIGRSPSEVAAVVPTHGHFDHMGFARRALREWGVPVFAHRLEESLARHPYSYAHERARTLYPFRHGRSVPILAAMVSAGALRVEGVDATRQYADGEELDIPGRPRVVFTPGHTAGHSSLHLSERSTIITGDALVTLDPYTGWRGPQIVSGAATADSVQAIESLERLAVTGADIVLPGHGRPWPRGIRQAADEARARGAS